MATKAYLIMDIGTGNVRVAIGTGEGHLLGVRRADVSYITDERYPESYYFEPDVLWDTVLRLSKEALSEARETQPDMEIKAITASSQREGVVLLDRQGQALIGLPNHDHRGREWEDEIAQQDRIYNLTGRYPSSLFSAFKLIGIRQRRPELYEQCTCFLSISDWAQYQVCGVKGYEHAQASETCLYDVQASKWSPELCEIFGISEDILPTLHASGTVLGSIHTALAEQLGLDADVPVIVGGADTQLAIQSTRPEVGDVVLVSGTTTPLAKITPEYVLDQAQRTWTNRHVEGAQFILEANTGVTGLNFQRLKEIFYPNEGYDVIEQELAQTGTAQCVASLGSLIADEPRPLTTGGFVFNTPVSHELTRAYFVRSALWDIACCIKGNYDSLCDVDPYDKDYIWACGGGFQSKTLGQFIANLLQKRIRIRPGFQQASVTGGVLICQQALGDTERNQERYTEIFPQETAYFQKRYTNWKKVRANFRTFY